MSDDDADAHSTSHTGVCKEGAGCEVAKRLPSNLTFTCRHGVLVLRDEGVVELSVEEGGDGRGDDTRWYLILDWRLDDDRARGEHEESGEDSEQAHCGGRGGAGERELRTRGREAADERASEREKKPR